MKLLNSVDSVKQLIHENDMVLIYFGGKSCNVCSAVKPKIIEILKNFPKIKSAQVDVEESISTAAEFNVFTIPVVLMFIEGKEIIREARHLSIEDINNKIERYYGLLFN